jgi:hypothetical protein
MKTNERNNAKSKQNNPDSQLEGGKNAPDIRSVNQAPKAEPNRPTNTAAGAKPRASGRQGSIDVQDGGQDIGSSAGSH